MLAPQDGLKLQQKPGGQRDSQVESPAKHAGAHAYG